MAANLSTPVADAQTAEPLDLDTPPPVGRARRALLRRLADVVCLPSSRVNAFERAMTADLLVEMLRDAEPEDRRRVAMRLAPIGEIPDALVRLLLRDDIAIASVLLEDGSSLSDPDLIGCIRDAQIEHRRMIAARRGLSEIVTEALAEGDEVGVTDVLLANTEARLSAAAVEHIVAASRTYGALIPGLLRRPELRPSHAYVLFWWAEPDARKTILQRFAVSREVLQDAAGDIFPLASEEGWQDALVRKALQFIERRQRNRAAQQKSPYEDLEAAVAAAEGGMTRELAQEIAYLSGVKPMTGAKIFTDPFGEPLAILCKATGLPRSALRSLWRGLRRPETDSEGRPAAALERTLLIYDMMAVDRAQTVLRYWNWSLSSALTPALIRAIRDGDEDALDEYSAPQRAAMLALAADYGASPR
jgi:uncharacterized protein (DUF2336 family)